MQFPAIDGGGGHPHSWGDVWRVVYAVVSVLALTLIFVVVCKIVADDTKVVGRQIADVATRVPTPNCLIPVLYNMQYKMKNTYRTS